jgi:hypothetical protein
MGPSNQPDLGVEVREDDPLVATSFAALALASVHISSTDRQAVEK